MIFGQMGEGKSFLMNSLAGEELFAVSNSMYSCTQGVDIGNRIVDHPTAETKMAFMDVEGQGDGKGQVSMCVPADAACCWVLRLAASPHPASDRVWVAASSRLSRTCGSTVSTVSEHTDTQRVVVQLRCA